MGFLDNSTNNIILDAVLTDLGRQALAKNDGSFSIFKFAFSDEEVDYGHIVNFGRTVGKEKIEKNTPILEASTQGSLAQKYRAKTVNNDSLTILPTLSIATSLIDNILALSPSGASASPSSKAIQIDQSIVGSAVVDPALTDFSYRVTVDDQFLTINGLVPDSVDDNNVAVYTIESSTSITSQNLTSLAFTVVARDVSSTLFESYQQAGASIVEKVVSVEGMSSGETVNLTVQVTL